MLNIPVAPSFIGSFHFGGGGSDFLEREPGGIFFRDQRLQIFFRNHSNDEKATRSDIINDRCFFLLVGELYNKSELCISCGIPRSEHDAIPIGHLFRQLYHDNGIGFLKRLNGKFSLVIRDEKHDSLFIAVDRFGLSKPIYYSIGKQLSFSTHLKLLLSYSTSPMQVDTQSLALFLKYSYIPSPWTIIKNIKKLGPGEMIICTGNSWRLERYINFEIDRKEIEEDEAAKEYTRLLSQSLSRRIGNDKNGKVGIFLSGGLDSSANVALASSLAKDRLESFGIGFVDPAVDERPFAQFAASHYGIPFHDYVFDGSEIEDLPKIVWYLEEPFLENGLFLTYAGFRSINSRVDTVITGNCTDQLFGTGGFTGGMPIALRYIVDKMHLGFLVRAMGRITKSGRFYDDNLLFKLKVMLDRVSDFNGWFFWGFDDSQLNNLCAFGIDKDSLQIFPNSIDARRPTLETYYHHSTIHQDLEHYACQNILVKTHRMAEMFSINARDPFLDNDLVDFILSLKLDLIRRGRLVDYLFKKTTTKYIHRKAMSDLLPQEILLKPKQGGAVIMSLLLEDRSRRGRIFDYIRNSKILCEYMNMQYIKRHLESYERISQNKINWQNYHDALTNQILYIMTFAIWYDVILNMKDNSVPLLMLKDMIS